MIAFFMETIENARFYCRIIKALPEHEQRDIVLFSLWPQVTHFLNETVPNSPLFIIQSTAPHPTPAVFEHSKPALFKQIDEDIRCSREFVVNKVAYDTCWNIYLHVLFSVMRSDLISPVRKVIFCSGNSVAEKAMMMVCRQRNIDTRFIELSNLPNKVFIDRLGSNARSELAAKPEILDTLPCVDEDFHAQWLQEYEKGKQGLPLQAINNPCGKIINLLSTDSVLNFRYPNFILLPLQVSYDTQLWINADIRNEDAIRYAHKLARMQKTTLVVKIHPAETSVHELENIARLKTELRFKVTRENTVELIKKAGKVVTINSTVGLEALLYKKPLEILGRSFYKLMDYENMKKYIHHYLFTGVEVRAEETIPAQTARDFLAR